MSRLVPIGFSIPACKIVQDVLPKTKWMSDLIPGDMSTYIYQNEGDYYQEYQSSVFATTMKKGGWDCLRHYEILANGSIPFFENLEHCPPLTMTHFPKELVQKYSAFYSTWKDQDIDTIDPAQYQPIIRELLDYTRSHLTTRKMADYFLETCQHTQAKSILLLSSWVGPDYQRCTLLHGLKEIMGSACHDYPRVNHLYTDCTTPPHELYGKGMSYSRLIDPALHEGSSCDEDIINDIRNHKYDMVVYGRFRQGTPFYDIVKESYDPQDVIMITGEDQRESYFDEYLNAGHWVFVREL